jgi:hypothetical protein
MVTIENSGYHSVGWKGQPIDAQPTTKRYGTKQYRPASIEIWYEKQAGQWVAIKVEIAGPQVKNDGTDGQSIITDTYYGPTEKYYDGPPWVLEAIAVNTPVNVP